ncbi:MAG TPA: tetratricopeptide repeat protein [Candidatus Hydrogenedentes bacterium]|nr:tetratricopeptide repeat protein [Candidatus Hydrogenedentota bacterium]
MGNENLTHSEASSIFFWKTVDFIRDNKMRTLKLTLRKAAYFWHPLEITENKVVQHEKWFYAPLKYLPGFPWAMALFLGGSMFLAWDWRRGRLRGHSSLDETTLNRLLFIIFAFVFTYFASFIPFFANARSRVPLYGVMLLIGAYGVKRIWDFAVARQYGRMAAGAALFGGMFLISSVALTPYTPDHDRWHYDRADSYLREGKVEEAIAEARAMMALPERPMYYMPHRLGVAFVRLGRYEEAVPLLRAALSPDPAEQDPRYRQDVYYLLGVALAGTDRYEEAVEAYEAALRLNPDDARTYNNLGVIREKQGDLAAAERHYREAVRSSREFSLAYSNLGDLLGRMDRLDEAIAHLQRAAELAPDNADYHYNLARHLAMAGRNEEAAAHYETAIELRPEDPRPYNNLGWMAQEAGDVVEAERRYRQAVAANPVFALGWINLLKLLVQDNRLADAVAACDMAVAAVPRNRILWLSFAEILAKHEHQDKAIAEYRKALAAEPGNPVIMNNLAILLVAAEQWGEAEALYRQAIAIEPEYAPAHCNLGVLLQEQGRLEEAMQHFRAALAADPGNEFAKKRLAAIQAAAQ